MAFSRDYAFGLYNGLEGERRVPRHVSIPIGFVDRPRREKVIDEGSRRASCHSISILETNTAFKFNLRRESRHRHYTDDKSITCSKITLQESLHYIN